MDEPINLQDARFKRSGQIVKICPQCNPDHDPSVVGKADCGLCGGSGKIMCEIDPDQPHIVV